MVKVIMPKMGDAMESGTLVQWLKKEGDAVTSGEAIANIETDKAVVELPAPGSGILSGILIKEGDTVPVGTPIALILGEGESLPAGWGRESAPSAPVPKEEEPRPEPVPAESPKTSVSTRRISASPLARKRAEEAGIALESIRGTGPGGRIVERDVLRALKEAPPAPSPVPPPQREPARAVALAEEVRTLNTLRRLTAERTSLSKREIPHWYVTVDVDVEKLVRLREQMNEENPDQRLSLNDFIIKACALALQQMPVINSSYENGKQHIHGFINIGIAVAVPEGLTLPVIKNCESKTLRQISREARDLAERARENKLLPDELSGSTFAISNMGMYDVEHFSAIINPPNAAIVAVASVRKEPVVREGDQIGVGLRMKITGSFDHRLIDGVVGAEFMGVLRKLLESPTLLLT